jgi:hypothetical protein
VALLRQPVLYAMIPVNLALMVGATIIDIDDADHRAKPMW